MHKLVVLYRRPPDPAHFRDHYERIHLPLVAMLPGIVRMHHSFEIEGIGGEPPYFCIFECVFASAGEMGAAMGSADGQAVAADVDNYAHGGFEMLHFPIPDQA